MTSARMIGATAGASVGFMASVPVTRSRPAPSTVSSSLLRPFRRHRPQNTN